MEQDEVQRRSLWVQSGTVFTRQRTIVDCTRQGSVTI